MPLYDEIVQDYPVTYVAGGSVQNSIRVCQWMLGKQPATVMVGCTGELVHFLVAGRCVMITCQVRTRTRNYCARLPRRTVCMWHMSRMPPRRRVCARPWQRGPTARWWPTLQLPTTSRRSTSTAPYVLSRTQSILRQQEQETWSLVERAHYLYIEGFFMTVSPPSILAVAKHAAETNKVLCWCTLEINCVIDGV